MANLELKDLLPGKTYYVQVRAKNKDGEFSEWSQTVPFTAPGNYSAELPNTYGNTVGSNTTQSGAIKSITFNGTLNSDWSIKTASGQIDPAYVGTTGWVIDYVGNAIFTNAYVKGKIVAESGTIGGFNIGTTSLFTNDGQFSLDTTNKKLILGTGNTIVVADADEGIWAGNATLASAPFSVTRAGVIYSTSGTIGGWNLASEEIYSGSGLSKISLSSANGKITIGTGNHGSVDTGFYTDSAGKFSLSNQLIFNPGSGVGTSLNTTGTFTTSAATITVPSGLTIIKGMTVTGTGIDTNTYVTNVSGTTITINKVPLSNQTGIALTFVLDDFAELQVVGRIKGVIDSTQIIGSPRLSTTISQVVVSGTSPNQTAVITTSGHAFIANEKILIESLPVTNGLNNLNREFVINTVTDSITLSISLSGVTGVTSSTTSSLSGVATLRELTMGLHPLESSGTSYEHSQGTGIRLDKYNWWFTNNQFRIGTSGSYLKWDGSKFVISGANSTSGYNLQMGIGPTSGTNYYSIVQAGQTPTYNTTTTPFYVDDIGKFSLGQKLTFDESGNLTINGSGTFSGSLSAATGTFSGSLSAATGTFSGALSGGTISIGSGNSIFKADTNGIYLGNATFGSAPFRVTAAGALTATGATISGVITATSGSFTGAITATSGTFTGTVNASSGSFSGYVTTTSLARFGTNISGVYDGLWLNAYNYFMTNGTAVIFRAGNSTNYLAMNSTDTSTRLQIDTSNSTYAVEVGGSVRATTFYGTLSGTATNAGTLDSLNSTSFLRSDAADTWAGSTLSFLPTGAAQYLAFDGGYTDTSNDPILTATGTAHTFGRIGRPGNRMYAGYFSLLYSGTTSITSDIREKTNIENSDLGLDFINMLRPVKYKMINGIKKEFDTEGNIIENLPGTRWHYGLIAQELKEILDSYSLDSAMWSIEDFETNPDGKQAISYNQIVSPLIKAVQELSENIEILKNKIALLENK